MATVTLVAAGIARFAGGEFVAGSGGDVDLGQVEVDVELVTGQGPLLVVGPGEQGDGPTVHQGELSARFSGSVGGVAATAGPPTVADQAFGRVECAAGVHLAEAHARPGHDQVQTSVGGRGLQVVREPCFVLGSGGR